MSGENKLKCAEKSMLVHNPSRTKGSFRRPALPNKDDPIEEQVDFLTFASLF